MRAKILAIGIMAAAFLLLGCDPPPPSCTRLCNKLYYAEEDYAAKSCGGLSSSRADTKKACRDSCASAWDETTTSDTSDASKCLNCISRSIPKAPVWSEVVTALNGSCASECRSTDLDYAWDSFYYDWYTGVSYNDPTCPPKFPPPPGVLDGGDAADGGGMR